MKKLSIVIPVYFNEKNLLDTYAKLAEEVFPHLPDYELILVDDGSGDDSYSEMLKLRDMNDRVKLIKFSRNFGHHIAVYAGLEHITGDCAVVISADLQDPPSLIVDLYNKYLEGYKIVLAVRKGRDEPFMQRLFSGIYYKLMKKYAIKDMPLGGFDCFLADRQVIETLTKIEEKNTSLFAQILWLGFKRAEVYYVRQARQVGESRYTLSKKVKLLLDSLLAFSYVPIRVISLIGVIDCLLSFTYALYIIIHKVMYGYSVGWSSLMVAIMFSSGVQMLTLGVIGEYLWRNFDESRKRPLYVLDQLQGIRKL
jgi:glycosyltransferase involved in cell wall biosynthesis